MIQTPIQPQSYFKFRIMVVYQFLSVEQKSKVIFVPCSFFVLLSSWFDRDIGDNTFKLLVNFLTNTCVCLVLGV
ncbi:TPA: hypothetical protein ACOIT4_001178 [Enterococcus faecalis]|uniref:Uncharacterized protein n=1 Tax=Enterococcus faecalis TaxID=1351 RepID=A0A2T5D2V4_ENTFL|nr:MULTISPECIES: hypothetical protein [Enterococcus]MDN6469006.1 hypothetical protein [Enterococcaceae bacterium]MDR4030464.1 hypothetical protein [Enterococcus sp.]AVK72618.1 hypothetical protein CEQ16_14845 [Enterococcus faecalis]AWQ39413.1 hypothetical protein CNQ40_06085 [Enterococcus faecalis]AXG88149.1 hypothetical protein DTO64_06110 [Enterococcus faecalis]